MYWSDTALGKMETSYINGTERKIFMTEAVSHYTAILLHDGYIYFTDWEHT